MTPGQVIAAIASFLAVLVIARAIWEPRQLRTTRITLYENENDKDAKPVKPAALTILFVSDLHREHLKVNEERLLSLIKSQKPDIMLFGGDLTAKRAYLKPAVDLLERMHQSLDGAGLPLIAVRGNHDQDESVAAMEQAGFIVLQNDHFDFYWHEKHFQIIGLNDPAAGGPDVHLALKPLEKAKIPSSQRLILTHNPDNILTVPPGQARWFFAGHFHGGQIYFPFGLEFRLLRHEKFPRIGLVKGLVQWRGITGYITRGLGCVLFPLRLRSLPEIAVIDLVLSGPVDQTDK